MKAFDELVETMETLLGPEGCPWDREQTLETLRSTLLEEACELIEAIDLNDTSHIQEELGDLFLNAIMMGKIAEADGRFTLEQALKTLNEKLIHRHPHVFGGVSVSNSEDVMEVWAEAKRKEKGKDQRKSVLDGIPQGLPALSRARKVIKRTKKTGMWSAECVEVSGSEEIFGEKLLSLAAEAAEQGIDPENALRKVLAQRESIFREQEAAASNSSC